LALRLIARASWFWSRAFNRRQVAAEFQGTVTVDRDPELAGARFTFTLPSGDGDTTD